MALILLITAHLFGDFILQSTDTANKKYVSWKHLLIHCLIYSLSFFVVLICFGPFENTVCIFLVIVMSHFIIDLIRIRVVNKFEKINSFAIFITDQIFHILIIFIVSQFIYKLSFVGNEINIFFMEYLDKNQIYNIALYIMLYIICISPAAVLIKKVFQHFSFQKDTDDLLKSGYYIGILERVIILTLGLNGEIGAIGFVIAAKSLARFKQLEDKKFAEKYLLGTLLSVVISLFCITIGNFLKADIL